MGRLTRAETQRLNRAGILAAAREEFAERGFREAKIDAIADRAELTRGAVYSNFPGKRALYFAVLADLAERAPKPPPAEPPRTAREALGAFARAWVTRLPLATDRRHGEARLGMDLFPEVLADERTRRPFAQLMKLDALLLGLALERLGPPGPFSPGASFPGVSFPGASLSGPSSSGPAGPPWERPGGRKVRVAEAALTTLHGASQMAAAAPGFVEPFDIVAACERLTGLDLGDRWPEPQLVPPARPADDPWSPPPGTDLITGAPAPLAGDGVVAILGLHRLSGAEAAVRAAPPGAEVTVVMVTADPAELAPLARLAIADLCVCLHQAFPPEALPRLRVVCDERGAVAAAAGVPAVADATEVAVRVRGGRIITRAEGLGACHAAAAARPREAPARDR
ncbi:TetR/AcrR family transcriptional regulator [Actinomadura viridis]|uniref:TetR/AcrR family transcriptional regulator n=1 Tax=Actinomadura viridis TaxID=58110 RepID=UPI0036B09AEA